MGARMRSTRVHVSPLLSFSNTALESSFRVHFSTLRVKYEFLWAVLATAVTLLFCFEAKTSWTWSPGLLQHVFELSYKLLPPAACLALPIHKYTAVRRWVLVGTRLAWATHLLLKELSSTARSWTCTDVHRVLLTTLMTNVLHPLIYQLQFLDHLAVQGAVLLLSCLAVARRDGICAALAQRSVAMGPCWWLSEAIARVGGALNLVAAGLIAPTSAQPAMQGSPVDSCRVLVPLLLVLGSCASVLVLWCLELKLRAAFLQSRGIVMAPSASLMKLQVLKYWNVAVYLVVALWLVLVQRASGCTAGVCAGQR